MLTTVFSCSKPPETLYTGSYDKAEMDTTIIRARTEVDRFLTEFEKQNGTDFSVKAPISQNGQTEHFGLVNLVYKNGEFEGEIGNAPGIVTNVQIGQKWKIAKTEISDWMFMREGKLYGNYTLRTLMKTMPKEEAARYRHILADPT